MSSPIKPILVLDWDGTCVESAWPGHGDWMPGAVEALLYLAQFCRLIIMSSRIAPVPPHDWNELRDVVEVDQEVAYIERKLAGAGIEAEVWDLRTKTFKPPAAAYVDDKAVHYSGRSGAWKALVPKLLGMAGFTDRAVLFPKEVNG